MFTKNGNILKINGDWLIPNSSPTPPGPGPSFDEVTIGTQTWMAKNLDVEIGTYIKVDNVTVNNVNLGSQYYYDVGTLSLGDYPEFRGWRVPTREDYNTLISYIGNTGTDCTKYRGGQETGWISAGTNDYGFSALPVGYIHYYTNNPSSITQEFGNCYLITNTLYYTQYGTFYYAFILNKVNGNNNPKVELASNIYMSQQYLYPVRLIKDT